MLRTRTYRSIKLDSFADSEIGGGVEEDAVAMIGGRATVIPIRQNVTLAFTLPLVRH